MLLTVTAVRDDFACPDATDLGYLLVKHPDRVHTFGLPWGHLAVVDRLVEAGPETFTPTRRLVVDPRSAEDAAAATQWWLALTGDGGEGMVVKPYAGLSAANGKGLLQPGLKCRGREYLRIIYGPGYTEPAQLDRLRGRSLGRKRGLALREHALGLAALDAAARSGPLWRVHELVFAILASESEPVDPRV